MNEPTKEQLLEFDEKILPIVSETHDASYRHGAYITQVFHRISDNTFWKVLYSLSTDGEEHGLAQGVYKISQVYPKQIIMTVYE